MSLRNEEPIEVPAAAESCDDIVADVVFWLGLICIVLMFLGNHEVEVEGWPLISDRILCCPHAGSAEISWSTFASWLFAFTYAFKILCCDCAVAKRLSADFAVLSISLN
jgi:hypothetical protein